MTGDENKPPVPEVRREMKWARFSSAVSGAAMVKVLAVVAGWWVGSQLDRVLGTKPWLMIVCFLAGAVLGFWYLMYIITKHLPK